MNDNNYNPNEIESKWYKKWECSGVFDSIPNKQKAFTITMPPPNVTGVLHMGHILNNTIQDAFIRYARMKNGTINIIFCSYFFAAIIVCISSSTSIFRLISAAVAFIM